MGLDGVEIVMKTEEAFDIRIEDAEVAQAFTPAQLIDLVMAKVANVETEFCLTHRAFNLLRKFLMQQLGFRRSEITPATRLSELFPRNRRRDFLTALAGQFGTGSGPYLQLPGWFQILLLAFSLACAVLLAALVAQHFGFGAALMVFLLGPFVSAAGAFPLSRRFATDFPFATLGDLATWVKAHKPDLASKCQKAWTRDQAAARVREIVINNLACEATYREDARFIQDLGLS